jgi:hypothetical protein
MHPLFVSLRASVPLVLLVLGLALVPAASASHSFSDVPNDHPFHSEIGIFKDTNITTGCTATLFCPQDFVRRQAMAAFVDRALGLVVRPGESALRAAPGSKIATIDDGSSLVRTFDGALELSHSGVRALRLEGHAIGPNVIGGFAGNTVTPGVFGATVSGGGGGADFDPNRVTDDYGTVAGGSGNRAGDDAGSTSDGRWATVGGGALNTASGAATTVAGGVGNTASGSETTVAGGAGNRASGDSGTVAGGAANTASGSYAAVAGGWENTAAGDFSFAAGYRAKANHEGSFVWGDSSNFDIASFANNSFIARTTGGARFVSAINGTTGVPTAGVELVSGGGSWTTLSDAGAKRDFRPVDGAELLRRLAGLPISTWSYKSQDPSIRHMGPTAQDFRRAFGLGESDRGITSVDADGVALAAIQALHAENQRLRGRVAKLERQNARLAALERAVAELTKGR